MPGTCIPTFPTRSGGGNWRASPDDFRGLAANHYDRLVHLCYGLFLVGVVSEVLARSLSLPRSVGVCARGQSDRCFECPVRVAGMARRARARACAAEAYNGQQGDMWDAQKDMALALAGALAATLFAALRRPESRPAELDSRHGSIATRLGGDRDPILAHQEPQARRHQH